MDISDIAKKFLSVMYVGTFSHYNIRLPRRRASLSQGQAEEIILYGYLTVTFK